MFLFCCFWVNDFSLFLGVDRTCRCSKVFDYQVRIDHFLSSFHFFSLTFVRLAIVVSHVSTRTLRCPVVQLAANRALVLPLAYVFSLIVSLFKQVDLILVYIVVSSRIGLHVGQCLSSQS